MEHRAHGASFTESMWNVFGGAHAGAAHASYPVASTLMSTS
jgi:hypothetical protein